MDRLSRFGSRGVFFVRQSFAVVAYLGRFGRSLLSHPLRTLRQAVALPGRALRIRGIVNDAFSLAAMDESLWAFWGFHVESWDPHYRARRWQKVRLAKVGPHQVVGIGVRELVATMRIAMEIEDPIPLYSRQSGEGFRFLLPSLSRYMGKNVEQADYAREHGLPWCESSWCEEEKRHAPAFARIITRLTGEAPDRENPNEVAPVTSSEHDSLHHLLRRQATEWGSSASYAMMAAHAEGGLHRLLLNILRDEAKHLAIIGAADRYLLGPRPWRRTWEIGRVTTHYIHHHEGHRSTGSTLSGDALTMLEILIALVLEEWRVRRWLRTLPTVTLRSVFEPSSTLPVIAAFDPPGEQRARNERREAEERTKRDALARWAPRRRRSALVQRQFEERYAAAIDAIVRDRLDGFRGAEEPCSAASRSARARIRRLRVEDGPLRRKLRPLRRALLDRLRDHQVRRNRYVRSRDVAAIRRAAGIEEAPHDAAVSVVRSG